MLPNLFNIVMAPLLRAFFTLIGTTTGVWVRFEQIRGDLFSYKAHLDGLELDISDQLKCSVKTCSLQFSLLDFSLETLVVSNVHLEGARLEYTHAPKQNLLPRNMPPFLIRNLSIKNSEIIFRDNSRRTPFALNMQIDDYYCEALQSQYLLFNAIFGSQMEGKLGSTPFSVLFKQEESQYSSKWMITGLPMGLVAPFCRQPTQTHRNKAP